MVLNNSSILAESGLTPSGVTMCLSMAHFLTEIFIPRPLGTESPIVVEKKLRQGHISVI